MPSPFDALSGTPAPNVNDPNIPVVGQLYKPIGGVASVVIQCTCDANTPIMLTGVGAKGMCSACKNGFMLQAVMFTPDGKMRMQIATGRVIESQPEGKGE